MNALPSIDDDAAFVARWGAEGVDRLRSNHSLFRSLSSEARDLLAAGDYASAAVWCEIAGFHAATSHSGIFASHELEDIAGRIARAALGRGSAMPPPRARTGSPTRILHVATFVHPVGGLSRMIWRWIEQDAGRMHSVALIRQRRAVPERLAAAVGRSGGRVVSLSRGRSQILSLAKKLRALAADVDLVVLHVDTRDVVPILAFADMPNRPTIAYLDHADHHMWLGANIADIVIGLRRSGLDLARARRGIAPERCVLLPIPVTDIARTRTRAEAKRELGIDPDATLLLSVARAVKFRPVDGMSYADAHLPFLKRHPEAVLMVVGSGDRADWASAQAEVPGRIIGLPETSATARSFEAADIYVDAFPFVSTTSLLEAGSYGLPLVSRFPFPDGSEILGADMPGLDGTLQRARSLRSYTAILERLVADPAYRVALGEATKAGIAAVHRGEEWRAALEGVYARAAEIGPVAPTTGRMDAPVLGGPDVFIPYIHGAGQDRDQLLCQLLGLMPLRRRARHWLDLSVRHGLNFGGRRDLLKCWVPSWLVARIRS